MCYYNNRHELTIQDGLILKGDRIIVPSTMRKEILSLIHHGHQGIETIKNRARSAVYWPNINKQLEEVVRCCDACQEFQRKQSAEPILEHEIPTEPWSKVASDLFSVGGKDYLIIVHYNSKYVSQIPDKSSQIVIQHTKNIFSRFGIPREIVSDNGPCYSSINYKRFAKEWDFNHVTISPEYPRSNGMVERTFQTVKRTIKKCWIMNEDVHLALLILRSTNKKGFEKSPGEILMKRTLRTTLPSVKTFRSGSFEESKTLK